MDTEVYIVLNDLTVLSYSCCDKTSIVKEAGEYVVYQTAKGKKDIIANRENIASIPVDRVISIGFEAPCINTAHRQ